MANLSLIFSRFLKNISTFKKVFFWIFLIAATNPALCQQTEEDSYTRYELLNPENHEFRIIYDVSATSAGATHYWNTLRKGSEHKVDAVWDAYSGKKLNWEIVDGETAKANGLQNADDDGEYLQVTLARPVPENGETRLQIDKTYADPDSYFQKDGSLVFSRSLGIARNSIVLPKGFEVTHCNYPSQVQLTSEGLIKLSFMNDGPQAVPLEIKARPLPKTVTIKKPEADQYIFDNSGAGRNQSNVRLGWEFEERANQNREIVYFLQQPETHSFLLYHDYTETKIGMDRYLNIVRAGSKASDPSAILLDTGESLVVETLKGEEITEKGIDLGGPITQESEVIAIWYEPIKEGETKRLRITETYTDENRYGTYGDELIWDRSFGRSRNVVILPPGWFLTTSSVPAVIDQNENGLTALHFVNDRPDNIDVYIKAQKK
ncbi:hypothetical protein SAMN03097699_1899 [Flavobacteriaceae bacterium MAR_2010_188]|nr:hypothetical protein SAMN03097699_1899 [Flavobacteriaceae bacterium MAR_2010_188]